MNKWIKILRIAVDGLLPVVVVEFGDVGHELPGVRVIGYFAQIIGQILFGILVFFDAEIEFRYFEAFSVFLQDYRVSTVWLEKGEEKKHE